MRGLKTKAEETRGRKSRGRWRGKRGKRRKRGVKG